jgi:hypothetical protein
LKTCAKAGTDVKILNIFAKKYDEKIGVFSLMQLGFLKKNANFSLKISPKIVVITTTPACSRDIGCRSIHLGPML